MRGETPCILNNCIISLFQSTLPMRGETYQMHRLMMDVYEISIHSPHAGRDVGHPDKPLYYRLISIHSPHAGRDECCDEWLDEINDFNPLSPCGERRQPPQHILFYSVISIHSPHAGRDKDLSFIRLISASFQSTLPMRGETQVHPSFARVYT